MPLKGRSEHLLREFININHELVNSHSELYDYNGIRFLVILEGTKAAVNN